jgi:hypothetical protein
MLACGSAYSKCILTYPQKAKESQKRRHNVKREVSRKGEREWARGKSHLCIKQPAFFLPTFDLHLFIRVFHQHMLAGLWWSVPVVLLDAIVVLCGAVVMLSSAVWCCHH